MGTVPWVWHGDGWKGGRLGEGVQTLWRGPMTWKHMPKNALKSVSNWRTNKMEQLNKVSSPCLDDHQNQEGRG